MENLEINPGEELAKIIIGSFIDEGKPYEDAVVDAWCLICDVICENSVFYAEDRLFDLMQSGYILKEFQTK